MDTSLRGKTTTELVAMIQGGELTQKAAEKFVAERAVAKLRKAQGDS